MGHPVYYIIVMENCHNMYSVHIVSQVPTNSTLHHTMQVFLLCTHSKSTTCHLNMTCHAIQAFVLYTPSDLVPVNSTLHVTQYRYLNFVHPASQVPVNSTKTCHSIQLFVLCTHSKSSVPQLNITCHTAKY